MNVLIFQSMVIFVFEFFFANETRNSILFATFMTCVELSRLSLEKWYPTIGTLFLNTLYVINFAFDCCLC